MEDNYDILFSVIYILSSFFKEKSEPSDLELQGLYAELYTIKFFSDTLKLEQYWHTNDRSKFDFSITDKLKIEIKSTLKKERIHHFNHEQLLNNVFEIFVISYMLSKDECGLSLFDLMVDVKPLLENHPSQMLLLSRFEKNTSEQKLKLIKYSEQLTDLNLKICKAEDIPKFNEITPLGVSNAEYDCNLTMVKEIKKDDFIKYIISIEKDNSD